MSDDKPKHFVKDSDLSSPGAKCEAEPVTSPYPPPKGLLPEPNAEPTRAATVFKPTGFTIRRRLIMGLAIILVLLLLGSVISIWQLNRLSQAVVVLEEETYRVSTALQFRLTIAEVTSVFNTRRVLEDEDVANLTSFVTTTKNKLKAEHADFKSAIGETAIDVSTRTDLDNIEVLLPSFLGSLDRSIEQAHAKRWEEIKRYFNETLQRERDLLIKVVDRMLIESGSKQTTAAVQVVSARQGSALITLIVIVMVLTVTGVTALTTLRSITVPVKRLVEGTIHVATGNMKERIPIERKDELGHLAAAFNMMTAELQVRTDESTIANKRLLQEITQHKRTEEELKKHRNHLEEMVESRTKELKGAQKELILKERLAALGQLTATVAHEIRNPLGTVKTSVFSIGDAIKRKEMKRVDRALSLAERNIRRCDEIITELLDFTRQKELKKSPMDIDVWLEVQLDEYKLPEEIEYKPEMNSGILIPFDPEYFRRAVINVVTNAVQALEDEESQDKELKVKTAVDGNRLEISVIDTGPGIPDDIREKVFDPLFSTKSFGVGMGLAIVKDIMEKHGGGIEVESEPGKGTEVVLWLPIN